MEDDNKLDDPMSTLTHAPFEPVPEEYQQNKTLSEDTAAKVRTKWDFLLVVEKFILPRFVLSVILFLVVTPVHHTIRNDIWKQHN